jgi:hypothetical protein
MRQRLPVPAVRAWFTEVNAPHALIGVNLTNIVLAKREMKQCLK